MLAIGGVGPGGPISREVGRVIAFLWAWGCATGIAFVACVVQVCGHMQTLVD